MEQKEFAGVGNWIADEVLYQAAIHPETPINQLSEGDLINIFEKLQYVLKTAIEHEAVYDNFPEHFLIHHRQEGGICFYTGDNIERIVVGGRGTFISAARQKKP
jgi:formamidopyrimidine-DNA glycosylase